MLEPTDWHAARLAECARGNQSALESLIDRDGSWLKAVCLRILRDEAAAEDALQEGLLQVWSSAASFQPALGSGRGWIYTVVRHAACRAAKAQQSHFAMVVSLDPEAMEDCLCREASADPAEAVGRLDLCLEGLGEGRRLLEAVVLDGVRSADLAEQHGRPLNTIKTWVRRGLQRLKVCMA